MSQSLCSALLLPNIRGLQNQLIHEKVTSIRCCQLFDLRPQNGGSTNCKVATSIVHYFERPFTGWLLASIGSKLLQMANPKGLLYLMVLVGHKNLPRVVFFRKATHKCEKGLQRIHIQLNVRRMGIITKSNAASIAKSCL